MPDEPPPLKTDPKHGYYPWWPEDGDDWVHPEDVAAARRMIPSTRIWRRDGCVGRQGEYVVMHYGETRLRVRRTLWREAPYEGLDLGDWVEVRPRGLTNEPHTGRIREMRWDEHAGAVHYWLLLTDGTPLEKPFEANDLKPVDPPSPRPLSRHEPNESAGDDPIDLASE